MTGKSPYLLDTHTVIWAVENPSQLSRNATAAMRTGERILSVATFWEVEIKSRRNLLGIPDPVTWWSRVVFNLDAVVLSIRPEHVAALAGLDSYHKDPFDRIMIAQSIAEGYTFITNDSDIKRYPVKTLW